MTAIGTDYRTRSTDPETSHEASASLDERNLSKTRRQILRILRRHEDGLTDEQIAELFPSAFSPSGLRTRRAELVAGGLVYDSGQRTPTASGRRAIVWRSA